MESAEQTLKEKFDIFLSIGYNCFPKMYISKKLCNGPTNFFDYIGTSMWSINEILSNDFFIGSNKLFNKSDYGKINIRANNASCILGNKKYFLRFVHDIHKPNDINNDNLFNNFVDKYERRAVRFMETLKSAQENKQSILFMRIEEKTIIPREYMEKSSGPGAELEKIKEFSSIVKSKFNGLKFFVIYLTTKYESKLYGDDNILVVSMKHQRNTFDINISNAINSSHDLIKQIKLTGISDRD